MQMHVRHGSYTQPPTIAETSGRTHKDQVGCIMKNMSTLPKETGIYTILLQNGKRVTSHFNGSKFSKATTPSTFSIFYDFSEIAFWMEVVPVYVVEAETKALKKESKVVKDETSKKSSSKKEPIVKKPIKKDTKLKKK